MQAERICYGKENATVVRGRILHTKIVTGGKGLREFIIRRKGVRILLQEGGRTETYVTGMKKQKLDGGKRNHMKLCHGMEKVYQGREETQKFKSHKTRITEVAHSQLRLNKIIHEQMST